LPGVATVPSPERIATAVAEVNQSARRVQPLQLEFRVQIGERTSVATGVLLVDPRGYARLELRAPNGLVERHLLRGGETLAARNGEILDAHRYFLPPLYVLQAENAEELRILLEGMAVDFDRVGLAECGDEDCLVVGDVGRDIPRRGPPPVLGLELYEEVLARSAEAEAAEAAGLSLEEWQEISAAEESDRAEAQPISELAPEFPEPGASAAPPDSEGPQGTAATASVESDGGGAEQEGGEDPLVGGPQPAPSWPGLWVDRKSFAIRGMDSADGVRTRLGPVAIYNGIRVPAWIYIREPGREAVRLHVLGVSPASPTPETFDPKWLLSRENPPGVDSSPVVKPPLPAGDPSVR
jgi:hypothetical protein